MSGETIVVIAGPTASGKTAAAVELALRHGGELVGADSVQVYRGFDIGSAKPTAAELRGVRQHLVNVADADAPIDAMGYARLADAAIADIAARGRLPIVVGGTGLWLRALVRGLVAVPPVDPEIRARLTAEGERDGAPALHARLARVDPKASAKIHANDLVRIVRALEVHEQTGIPMGELRARHALGAPRYRALFVALTRPREELYARIAARVAEMIGRGFADEVRALVARHGAGVRPLGAVGYKEMLAHVVDGTPLAETVARIERASRVYARRQRVWLAREPGVDAHVAPEALLAEEGWDGRIRAHLSPERPITCP